MCFSKTDKIENYYFDDNAQLFKPCYNICKYCNEFGDDNNNKCINCVDGYYKKDDDDIIGYLKNTIIPNYYFNNISFTRCLPNVNFVLLKEIIRIMNALNLIAIITP
jgi:hypothetical protein